MKMGLHEALVIFGLDYNYYTQQEIDQAYGVLCDKVAPSWRAELDDGKSALEDALSAYGVLPPSRTTGGAVADGQGAADVISPAALALTQLWRGRALKGFKPTVTPHTSITPLKLSNFKDAPIERFASSLIPLLKIVSDLVSFDDPRAVPPRTIGLLTIVLDLDETLVSAREGSIQVRPYARAMLKALSELKDVQGRRAVEIVLFSAGDRQHVDACRRLLDPGNKLIQHSVCRGASWLSSPYVLKDISLLGRPEGTCLLIDDSPYSTMTNGHSCLLIPPFQPEHPTASRDTTLLYVLQVVTCVSHMMSHQAHTMPVAFPDPGFGRKYRLEAPPALCAVLKSIEAQKTAAAPGAAAAIETVVYDAAAGTAAYMQAIDLEIRAQLAATKAKIETADSTLGASRQASKE